MRAGSLRVAGALLGLLAALGLDACSCRTGCAPEPAAPSASAAQPDEPALPASAQRPYASASTLERVGQLFCINEAVAVPARLVRGGSMDARAVQQHLRQDASTAVGLGATFVRVNSATYPFANHMEWQRHRRSWERMDSYLAVLQRAGLEPVVVLGPWPGNHTANYTERYLPQDMDAYLAWVSSLVERYDGDGVDDAPGLLRGLRYWEVDNEPDLHNRVPPRDAKRELDPSTFETPAEYGQLLVATAAAIRAAQPAAVVLNGGTFHTARPWGRAYLEQVLEHPGAQQAVDAVSVHAYFEEQSPELYYTALDNAQQLAAGRPVFVTETGVPAQRRGSRWVDEQWQARMLALVFGEAMARGVERVCWHSLSDPPANVAGGGGGFGSHSLTRVQGASRIDKPAGAVYRRLVEQAGSVPVAEVQRVPVQGGRAVRLGAAGWLVYEGDQVQLPFKQGTVVDLLSGAESALAGAVQAPVLVRAAGE